MNALEIDWTFPTWVDISYFWVLCVLVGATAGIVVEVVADMVR